MNHTFGGRKGSGDKYKKVGTCPYCDKPITTDPRSAFRDSRNPKIVARVMGQEDMARELTKETMRKMHVKVHKFCEGKAAGVELIGSVGMRTRWEPKRPVRIVKRTLDRMIGMAAPYLRVTPARVF